MVDTGRTVHNAVRTATLLVDGRPAAGVRVAATPLQRLRGLLGRRNTDEALLLLRCTSVHAVGMLFTLDVALLTGDPGGELTVLRTTVLRPFGMTLPRRGVQHVLEAQRGAFAAWGVAPGVRLQVEELGPDLGPGWCRGPMPEGRGRA
jgi:uncharacterized membrane protein (UPF0127 family)